MSILKPEEARYLLLSFFERIIDNVEQLPNDVLGRIGVAPVFTDLQVKQMIIPSNGKKFYCINFALITESEQTRKDMLFLLEMMTAQTLGPKDKGYTDLKKRVTAYRDGRRIL